MSKVRIYDLAKELKLESKKILEDARRMGVDVSVPSNTLDDNIAAKIREMYYPKKEQAPAIHRARLIKHQTTPGVSTGLNVEQTAAAPATESAQEIAIPAESPPPPRQATQPMSQTTVKQITPPKPAPAPRPVPTAPPAQQQATPDAEPKSRIVKLATPPAAPVAEPAQEPPVEVEQAVPSVAPSVVEEAPAVTPLVEEPAVQQVAAAAQAEEIAP